MTIAPEDRLRNLSKQLVRLVDGPSFPGRQWTIRDTIHQLHEELDLYLRGELPPLDSEGH
jgi:hypothetical protein